MSRGHWLVTYDSPERVDGAQLVVAAAFSGPPHAVAVTGSWESAVRTAGGPYLVALRRLVGGGTFAWSYVRLDALTVEAALAEVDARWPCAWAAT